MDAENTIIRLRLVRHGETKHNKSQTLAGQQPGELTPLGCTQAQMIGAYFHKKTTPFDFIYVSDLGRTKQTFQNACLKAPHLKLIDTRFTPLIRQRKAGVLENKPLRIWADNAKKEGKDIRVYKCEGGENWEDVMERARQFLELLVVEHCIKKQGKGEVKILGVTHGGFIMQFHNTCNRVSGKPIKFSNSAKNCSMHEFQISYPQHLQAFDEAKVKIKCVEENFVGHLQA